MEIGELEEVLQVLDSSLVHLKWRLKPPSKRHLQTDILALCTGMRPVVMVDYGGKMPELLDHLCALIRLCEMELSVFKDIRVMVIEEMIYLIHVEGIAKYVRSSLNAEVDMLFVNLQVDPPKMVTQTEESSLASELIEVQKIFSLVFPVDGICSDSARNSLGDTSLFNNTPIATQSSEFVDLSSCMQDIQVTIPTLNGWLLGYPVVYLFDKEHIADAIYNLSTKYLHIYRILVRRNIAPYKECQPVEELLSFSVPYELSVGGSNEAWAKEFLAQMQSKWERCERAWKHLQMEVCECNPQAIVL